MNNIRHNSNSIVALFHGFSLTDISFPFIDNTSQLNDCERQRAFVDSNIALSKQKS
jgi:hypothetical protein